MEPALGTSWQVGSVTCCQQPGRAANEHLLRLRLGSGPVLSTHGPRMESRLPETTCGDRCWGHGLLEGQPWVLVWSGLRWP